MSSHVGMKQQERRLIEEKIAKVREVVRNVTTNDIVLALHSHDMDVEAAIRAFCEGGTSVALGEWEQPTNKQKGRQAAKKAAKRQVPSQLLSKGSVAGSISANGTGTNKSPSNTKTSSTANSVVNGYTSLASSTGVNGHVATPPPSFGLNTAHTNLSLSAAYTLKHPPAAANKQSKKPQGSGGSGGGRGSDDKRNRNQHGIDVPRPPLARTLTNQTTAINKGIDAKVHAIRDDATHHLSNYAGEMELLEHNFHTMMNQSEEALGLCFRQIQQCLVEREQQLRAELAKCRNSGASIYTGRQSALAALQSKAASMTNHSQHADVEKWIEEWETFNREKSAERDLIAGGDRLTIDVTPLLAAIRHLGQVASIDGKRFGETPYGSKPATHPKNGPKKAPQPAADQHSLRSDPSSPGKEVEKMHIPNGCQGRAAEIMKPSNDSQNGIPANGSGIVMHSEALSYEELAALQRQIEETLKAQGIDPSVLADTSLLASASAPPRRRAPNSNSNNNNQGGGSRAGKYTNTESGNNDKRGPRDAGGHPPQSSSTSSRNHTHRQTKK